MFVCVCEHLQRAGACAPVTLDGTRVALSAKGEVCSTLMCAGTVRVCVINLVLALLPVWLMAQLS